MCAGEGDRQAMKLCLGQAAATATTTGAIDLVSQTILNAY